MTTPRSTAYVIFDCMIMFDIENMYKECCRISKISNEVGRIDNFRAFPRKLSFLPSEFDSFEIRQYYCMYSIYLSTSDLLSFIISNTDKHEFSSIRKWIRCCNDVMNNIDCVIKRDVRLPAKNPFMF